MLVKVPRRIRSVVIFPNQRSTRFNHDDEVGMKWKPSKMRSDVWADKLESFYYAFGEPWSAKNRRVQPLDRAKLR
jgi:hypothetical protein